MTDASVMQVLRRHEGTWEGTYRHYAIDGSLLDEHQSRVECIFPVSGSPTYVQRNRFEWRDGRVETVEFAGEYRDGRLWWDTERFSGSAWTTGDDIVLLKLDRRDEPGSSYTEIILLEDGADQRFRTWHWFAGGVPVRRTLCDEHRVL